MNAQVVIPVPHEYTEKYNELVEMANGENLFKYIVGLMAGSNFLHKHEFIKALRTMQGNRTVNEFGNQAGVSGAYIKKMLDGKIDIPPDFTTLTKLHKVSQSRMSLDQLKAMAK